MKGGRVIKLKTSRVLRRAALLLVLLPGTGCRELLAPNLQAGLRDGLVTAATGLIDDAINAAFSDDGRGAGNGNDLFVRI